MNKQFAKNEHACSSDFLEYIIKNYNTIYKHLERDSKIPPINGVLSDADAHTQILIDNLQHILELASSTKATSINDIILKFEMFWKETEGGDALADAELVLLKSIERDMYSLFAEK